MADPIVPIDIATAANRPLRTRTEEGTVEEHSLSDLVKAQQALSRTTQDAVPYGIRIARIQPGSTTPGA